MLRQSVLVGFFVLPVLWQMTTLSRLLPQRTSMAQTVTSSLTEHPLASRMVTVYTVVVSGQTLMVCAKLPVLHVMVYGGTPPPAPE
jgi:hypothetical protein